MRARRVLVTDADAFLGPAVVKRFADGGDHVTATTDELATPDDVERLVQREGPFDVAVLNLDVPITVAPIVDHRPTLVSDVFRRLVERTFWLIGAVAPPMIERADGAIVVPTSATVMRSSSHRIAAYEAARGAQHTLVRSAGAELAPAGVRVNGVAPNFIENPSYFPPNVVADPEFQASLRSTVPAGRLGRGDEAADAVAWLASPAASYVFGVVLPIDGGWRLGGV